MKRACMIFVSGIRHPSTRAHHVRRRQRFLSNRFLKCSEFAPQTFEHRIDGRWKRIVVPCLKLRDLRPQPLGPQLIACQHCPIGHQLAIASISAAILIVEKLEKVSDIA